MQLLRLKTALGILISLFLYSFSSFAGNSSSIQIKGSDTMVNLGQSWAEEFMTEHPSASVAVTGGGSGTGIAALINGTCDIAQSSRSIEAKERDLAKQKGLNVQEIVVANDAIVMVAHPDNPVQGLTIDQLSDIFTGKIKNWKEVGGKDAAILVLSRERNSGTHVFVLEAVVRKGNPNGPEEFAPTVLMMPSSQAIEQEVAGNQTAIGYFGLGYLSPKVKAFGVFQNQKGTFVKPSVESVLDRSYPIHRSLLFYLPREPEGTVKEFVNFVLSERGQEIVLEMKFVPTLAKDSPRSPKS